MRLRVHTLDVFTSRRLSGNPLAVVLGGDALDTATMQAIARELNLSETAFALEPRDPVNTARIRIFTPAAELPFAGHPTIGAAALIARTRASDMLSRHGLVVALEEEIGVLRCDVMAQGEGVAFARFETPLLPVRGRDAPPAATLAEALGLAAGEIGFDRHIPSVFTLGGEFLFVPVRSRAALERARPTPPAFAATLGAMRGAYLYTTETEEPGSAVQARYFPSRGVPEDPATGSAAAAFAGVAEAFEAPEDGEHELVIEQGHAMGRPSRILLGSRIEAGRLTRVTIAGQAVEVLRGELEI